METGPQRAEGRREAKQRKVDRAVPLAGAAPALSSTLPSPPHGGRG